MDHEGQLKGSTRLPPLAQAGLAALVAGSLLTFSALAFNTAFDGVKTTEITAEAPHTDNARPVVLPATPSPAPKATTAPDDATPASATTVAVGSIGDVSVGVVSSKPEPRSDGKGKKVPPGHARRLAGVDGFARTTAGNHHDSSDKSKGKDKSKKDKSNNGNHYGHHKANGNGHHKGNDSHGGSKGATKSHHKSHKKGHGKGHAR